ncbi:MAG: hypothetical protein CMI00_11495 [Oceanospirillaceae bacterium]|nr:hypothetical protein [Oceanospirillaceae bacterium]|tara:strand:- start:6430 stop:7389 length:960 start_codon:yes stop_codon:yes gene_type:complete
MNIERMLFIHIPKTAGSSFRLAAERYFGKEFTFFDYGPKSHDTHALISKYEYEVKDRYLTGKNVCDTARFLSGHFNYPKYAPFFSAKEIVTFVRDPAQQVRSHYEHFVRHHAYDKDFLTFITTPQFSNLQSRMMSGTSLDSLGFIGLTEQYEESLALLNRYLGVEIESLDINKNDSKKSQSYEFTAEETELLKAHNKDDIALYKECLRRFERQKKAISSDAPFVRGGKLPVPPKERSKIVNGWAACYESEEAMVVQVEVEGKVVRTLTANEYRPFAMERSIHRKGYVGFTFPIPDTIPKGKLMKFRAAISGEILFKEKR